MAERSILVDQATSLVMKLMYGARMGHCRPRPLSDVPPCPCVPV